jgi:hypothetical protein
MNTLLNAIKEARVGTIEIADYLGISYFTLGQMLSKEIEMSDEIKKKVKNFLVSAYTNRIDTIL